MESFVQVGDVVDDRYKILEKILTTPLGDTVFVCMDTVLHRCVLITIAAEVNVSILKNNAKKLALLSEKISLKILDLGTVNFRTYVVTNKFDPNKLLEMVFNQKVSEPVSGANISSVVEVTDTKQIKVVNTQKQNIVTEQVLAATPVHTRWAVTSVLGICVVMLLSLAVVNLKNINVNSLLAFDSAENVGNENLGSEQSLELLEVAPITNVSLLMNSNALEEKVSDLPKLFDNNFDTIWDSWEYVTAPWGNFVPDGVGFLVALQSESKLSSLVIQQAPNVDGNGVGGSFEIRASDNPKGENSRIINSGLSFSGDKNVILFEPAVETKYLVIWVASLPKQNSRFALKISEIFVT